MKKINTKKMGIRTHDLRAHDLNVLPLACGTGVGPRGPSDEGSSGTMSHS